MHGRVKVQTTEEQKLRKQQEQNLKLKLYRAVMSKVNSKRQKQELDDEMLELTTKILIHNPDVLTLWNIRRECLLQKRKVSCSEPDQSQACFDTELRMTEQCLLVNPKSYNCWHHRCWVLENCPKPDWQKEVQLCNQYLKMDERNFHTWDYRRYVVAKAGISIQEELDFCTAKINANFSNYSSWHYRSKLLPQLFPNNADDSMRKPLCDEKLRKELEMVLTGAFTDPDDSSPWFYQRWLLGYSRPELMVCAFRLSAGKVVIAFTRALAAEDFCVSLKTIAGEVIAEQLQWQQASGANELADTVWYATLKSDFPFSSTNCLLDVHLENIVSASIHLVPFADGLLYFKPPNISVTFSADIIAQLEPQLGFCEGLLKIEPNSKWTLLTCALIMRAIDRTKYHTQSLEHLKRLEEVDKMRIGYYRDLAANWILEKLLEDWQHNSITFPRHLDLSSTNLFSIPFPQYACIADKITLPENLTLQTDKRQRILTFYDICKK